MNYNCLPFFVANVTVHLVLQLEFALVSSVLVGFGTMSGSYNNFSKDDDDLPFVGWTGKSIGGGPFSLLSCSSDKPGEGWRPGQISTIPNVQRFLLKPKKIDAETRRTP